LTLSANNGREQVQQSIRVVPLAEALGAAK